MASNDKSNVAETWFNEYLTERGYSWETEPDIGQNGTVKNPDRLVTARGIQVVCEIKSFNTAGLHARKPVARLDDTQKRLTTDVYVSSPKDALKPIRSKIREAAPQLKTAQELKGPLVVVLANPMRCQIPSDDNSLIAAMYGDPMVLGWLDPSTGEFVNDWALVYGRNGKLTGGDHGYLSAVAWLHHQERARPWLEQQAEEYQARLGDDRDALIKALREIEHQAPAGADTWLTIVETVSDTATRLPRDIFNGPCDVRYVPTADKTEMVVYQGPPIP